MTWLELWKEKEMTQTTLLFSVGFALLNSLLEILNYSGESLVIPILAGIVFACFVAAVMVLVFTFLWMLLKVLEKK